MFKSILLFSLGVFLASCGKQPSSDELAKKIRDQPEVFERLKTMIQEDTKSGPCFTVGLDKIGDYWEHDNRWNHSSDYDKKLSLAEVLEIVGLSDARYEYKKAFAASGSERVDFCPASDGGRGPWISILIYRAGLGVSGCLGDIDWRPVVPESEGRRGEGDFTEITPLGDGWYLKFSCT
jgi:hypothetical protein